MNLLHFYIILIIYKRLPNFLLSLKYLLSQIILNVNLLALMKKQEILGLFYILIVYNMQFLIYNMLIKCKKIPILFYKLATSTISNSYFYYRMERDNAKY